VVHRLNKGSAIGGNQQVSTLARAHTVIRGRLTWNGAECIALRIVHVVVVDDLLVGGKKKRQSRRDTIKSVFPHSQNTCFMSLVMCACLLVFTSMLHYRQYSGEKRGEILGKKNHEKETHHASHHARTLPCTKKPKVVLDGGI
jgi:hypothetical protein